MMTKVKDKIIKASKIGFIIIFAMIAFGAAYLSEDADKKSKAAAAAAANDPKKLCYRNGVKVGKTEGPQIYTKNECSQLGGTPFIFPNNGFLVCQRPGKLFDINKHSSYTSTDLQSISFNYFCADK